MTNIIYKAPDSSKWLQGYLDTSTATGYQRIINTDKTVFSMQPGGVSGSRPSGTDGPWEQGATNSNALVYTTNDGGESYPVLVLQR